MPIENWHTEERNSHNMNELDEKKLKEIIQSNANNPFVTTINDDSDLIDDLGIDSLGMINMVIIIENAFSIKFPDDSLTFDNLRLYSSLKANICNCLEETNYKEDK